MTEQQKEKETDTYLYLIPCFIMQSLQKLQAEKGNIGKQLAELKNVATVESRLKHLNDVHFHDKDQPFAIQYSTIHKAAYDGNVSGLQYFLSLTGYQTVNVDVYDQTGKACIHIASERGHTHIVDYLLSKGANIDLTTIVDNTTPLMYACCENKLECIEKLLKNGALIFKKNISGFSAMHYCAQGDHVEGIIMVMKYCTGIVMRSRCLCQNIRKLIIDINIS